MRVANGNSAGVIAVDYPITITDVLPAGLTFVSGIGSGWTCSAVAQTVTCTHPNTGNLLPGSALPDVALTVAVGNGSFPVGNTAQNVAVSNTATVTAVGTVDINTVNNSATDTATVLGSNLSTSTKTVADLNGGDANPGDTLRYTVSIVNSSGVAATGVVVTDDVPGNTGALTVVSYPPGATDASSAIQLNVSNISVPANGSVTVVFDVTVAAGTSPGATINNTATIANPAGVGGAPVAPQVIVSQSQIAGSGTKQLYLWSAPGNQLSRTRPTGTHNDVTIAGNNQSSSWTIAPVLQKAIALQAGSYPVLLLLRRTGSNSNTTRTITVTLNNSVLGAIGSATQTFSSMSSTEALYPFTLTTSAVTAPVGSTFTLTVNNNSGAVNRNITVRPYTGTTYSRVELNSATIINVDSVQMYGAAYAGGVVTTTFVGGSTAYIRAVVSDPFGSFDISAARLTLRNPAGTDVLTATPMTQVNDSGAATRTYEYAYAIPANAPLGNWTARVTANEGAEGTITDLGIGTFMVSAPPVPSLRVTKTSAVVWDPVNLDVNPKRIAGSVIAYTVTVVNSGPGTVDASTLMVTDAIPADTVMCVTNTGQCTAVQFVNGSPVSGLSYAIGNTTYSANGAGGAPYNHTLSPDAQGQDAAVTGVRFAPTGTMTAASISGNPSFSINFRVRVK